MAGIKIVDLPAVGRDLISTDLLELSLAGGTGSRKITGQEIMNASKLSVGNTPIINGAVGQVLFQGTGNVLQESANLFWDNTNGRLGIGTSSPIAGYSLHATQGIKCAYIDTTDGISANAASFSIWNALNTTGKLVFITQTSGAQQTRMTIVNNGNVLINTTTDAGFKLDVNGTARVVGNTLLDSGIIATSTATTRLQGSLNYFTHNRIASSGAFGFQISSYGTLASFFRWSDATYDTEIGGAGSPLIGGLKFFTAGTEKTRITSGGNVLIGTTTDDGYKLDVNGTARVVGPTFAVGDWTNRSTSVYVRAATGGSENRGFFIGTGASNDGNVGSFTYQPTGNLLNIRSPYNSGTVALSFEGNTNSTQFHNISGTAVSKFFSNTGNWGINTTTDAGYKLDVNGTARVVNALTLGNVVLSLSSQGGGTISCANSAGANTGAFINLSGPVFLNPTAGNSGMFAISGQYAPSSGTANFNHLNLAPTLNTTGTYSGIVRGMYYNPTLTSTTGVTAHFAIHTTAGRVRFENLPTSPTGLNAGDLYNNLGVLMIV